MKIEKEDSYYINKFNKLSNKNKVSILFDSLSYMQQYNGRSIDDCIVLAMKNIS